MYHAFIQAAGPDSRLVPLPMTTLVGWHPEAHQYMQELPDTVASRAMVSRVVSRAAVFQRHAARLVENNVKCLMDGIDQSV